jgi:hypothetical protein
MIIRKKPITVLFVRRRAFLSDISGSAGLKIFSIKSAEGARRVQLAVDMIAERSAPKNITCTNTGVASRISDGRTLCVSSVPVTRSGAIINAANPSIIGRNAIMI